MGSLGSVTDQKAAWNNRIGKWTNQISVLETNMAHENFSLIGYDRSQPQLLLSWFHQINGEGLTNIAMVKLSG